MKNNPKNHAIGSSLEDLLKEENIYSECNAAAVKELIAMQLNQVMQDRKITKKQMALKMNTSRASLDRLLDGENISVTLQTLIKAATTLGRTLKLELV